MHVSQGAVRWTLVATALFAAACGEGTPAPPASPAGDGDAIRAEFEVVARRLFATEGGPFQRDFSGLLRGHLAAAGDSKRELELRIALVQTLLREGGTREAASEVDQLLDRAQAIPGLIDREPLLHQLRGLTYLRLAEVENCIARHNADCCVYPLRDGGVHERKEPARAALASYEAYAAKRPQDLAARYLLNIAHMAAGSYPDGVPEALRIPERGPGAADDFPRFRDVAGASGITKLNHAGGAVIDDLDGDGLIDIVLSSCFPSTSLTWYRNRGDGTFEDRTPGSGLENQLGGLNLVSTDYDNDGDVDLFVLRGAWMFDEGCIRNSLLRNDGNGSFTDVTRAAGLAYPASPTQVGVWFDYDNDGDLDVFVGNESRLDSPDEGPATRGDYPCNLFRNNGDGTFTDVARAAGVTNDRYCKGATAGDYDNDGWMDLYVSNLTRNRLYRNRGNGTFTDVGEALGVDEPRHRSFAPWFFDFDNDGCLDIYVSAYESDARTIADIAAWQLGRETKAPPPRLYRNRGDGTFEDVTRAAGLWRPIAPMGASFGDLDNDGWLDMYLTTGSPLYEFLTPNVMLRNRGGARFDDVTVAGGFGNLQKGHGVGFIDLDDDGDQDVFNEVGGFYEGDAFYNALYENPGNANRHLVLRLVGVRSNRMAYGARVKVVVTTPAGERAIHRAVGSVSSFGAAQARQEIGLGDAIAIKSVEVWWPRSGLRETHVGLKLDGSYVLAEGEPEPRAVPRRPVRLGR